MYDVKSITSERSNDCGATALKMLLEYYDIKVDLNQLVEECNTQIFGCTGRDIMRVSALHGLPLKAYQCKGEDTVDDVIYADRPGILWWKYRHFVICCGIDDTGRVVICDPDKGRYRLSRSLVASFFSNVVMFNGEPKDFDKKDIKVIDVDFPWE